MNTIDHLLYGVPSLESGMDEIETLVGVRPVYGGKHKKWGTHNAVISLGPDVYLEIIAADPDAERPQEGVLFDLDSLESSKLITWVQRTDDVYGTSEAASKVGIQLGAVSEGQRITKDGSVLSWTLSDPAALPYDGAIPFLIDWGKTPHPATSAPPGCALTQLHIHHSDSQRVKDGLNILGINILVSPSEEYRLEATIKTKSGNLAILS